MGEAGQKFNAEVSGVYEVCPPVGLPDLKPFACRSIAQPLSVYYPPGRRQVRPEATGPFEGNGGQHVNGTLRYEKAGELDGGCVDRRGPELVGFFLGCLD